MAYDIVVECTDVQLPFAIDRLRELRWQRVSDMSEYTRIFNSRRSYLILRRGNIYTLDAASKEEWLREHHGSVAIQFAELFSSSTVELLDKERVS